MKALMFAKLRSDYEMTIALALQLGAIRCGVDFSYVNKFEERPDYTPDIVVVFGVKHKKIWDHYEGTNRIIIDKGYTFSPSRRSPFYWRFGVNRFHNEEFVRDQKMDDIRLRKLGIRLPREITPRGRSVVFAGGSLKYGNWHGLPHPTEYATSIIREMEKYTERPIIYRPKPSWREATPIPNTMFSPHTERFQIRLKRTYCVVTFGSNAAIQALCAGVPAIVVGDGMARVISETELSNIENPKCPTVGELRQFMSNVAYCQWNESEMRSGEAWKYLLSMMEQYG